MHHVLLAHGTAIQVMRGLGMENLGAVCNFEYAQPADDSAEALAAAKRYDAYYNRFFMSGIFHGKYPSEALEGLEPHLPQGWQDDFATITAPVDWCGLNYYTRKLIAPAPGTWPSLKEVPGPLAKTAMDWEVYPDGLYHFLQFCQREFTGDLLLYVTENGMANHDTASGADAARIDYISAHIEKVRQAAAEGIPVRGYFIWSLLDNYEWALGYDKRFGLVHVDFESLQRTPKASYQALKLALTR